MCRYDASEATHIRQHLIRCTSVTNRFCFDEAEPVLRTSKHSPGTICADEAAAGIRKAPRACSNPVDFAAALSLVPTAFNGIEYGKAPEAKKATKN